MIGLLSGCASIANDNYDKRDPFEEVNRVVFKFNDGVDKAILKPVSKSYEKFIPEFFRLGVSNFFGNLSDLVTTFQHLLQFDIDKSSSSASRFIINTTIGILGVRDVASELGIPKTNEDFGQTFGSHGVSTGPFVVLPFFGPSNVRDGFGKVLDILTDPFQIGVKNNTSRLVGNTLRVVQTRASLLSAEQAFEALAFDRYVGVKNAYLANRKMQVND